MQVTSLQHDGFDLYKFGLFLSGLCSREEWNASETTFNIVMWHLNFPLKPWQMKFFSAQQLLKTQWPTATILLTLNEAIIDWSACFCPLNQYLFQIQTLKYKTNVELINAQCIPALMSELS